MKKNIYSILAIIFCLLGFSFIMIHDLDAIQSPKNFHSLNRHNYQFLDMHSPQSMEMPIYQDLNLFKRPILGEHIGIWQITDDPTVRDHANYHAVDCWSPDGRYISYTHWGGNPINDKAPGNKASASIHVYDLHLRSDRKVDWGIEPRWGNLKNWLFYVRYKPEKGSLCEEGTELRWIDVDSGIQQHMVFGIERLGETDANDRWIYGHRRSCKPPWSYTTTRVEIGAKSKAVIMPNVKGALPLPNPNEPVLFTRQNDNNAPFEPTRLWYSLEDFSENIFVPMVQKSHMSWLGNGEYLLLGDGLIRGRRWNEPYPSNIHILAAGRVGDISACGRSGRYVCGDSLVADLRSGDAWRYINPLSMIVFPEGTADYSQIYDPDPKGSPDGTKICFVSNYPLIDGPVTRIAKTAEIIDTYLEVESTKSFPETGELMLGKEIIGYRNKTATRFEGITRGLFNSQKIRARKGDYVKLFEAGRLTKSEIESSAGLSQTMKRYFGDTSSPLVYQRQTDIYIAVVRQPDPPILLKTDTGFQLIPGESHNEISGYHLLRNGEIYTANQKKPGENIALNTPGEYRAIAVEWSGLYSRPSHPLDVKEAGLLTIENEIPIDFSWIDKRWIVNETKTTESEARSADRALCEIYHRYDGLIHRELYSNGVKIKQFDLNLNEQVTREIIYSDEGKLTERRYYDRNRRLVSQEKFNIDGFITESKYYRYRINNKAYVYDQWFYIAGVPVKRIFKEKYVYEKIGNEWRTTFKN